MQQLQPHYGWFKTFQSILISAFLVITLSLSAFTNATIFLLAQTPQNVNAQTTSDLVETSEAPKQVEVAQVAATSPTTPQNHDTSTGTRSNTYSSTSTNTSTGLR